ncbi:MAG: cupin domain-containing protein [Patescibacteria group bacterium]|nr:cupin domain-containing protein [Patescibacteria group bacterium]MDE1988493.1 cupin domain-containing protein [Patescibacteria group bacterium]MDE2218136.1 cupin domain-containing protein [Patescibacteria group bacterium]
MENKISKNTEAQAINPSDLIAYQDGSVVSREIIKKTNGSITVFAFDENEGLSEHTAPYDAILHVLEGEAEVKLSGKSHLLKEKEVIIMPAGEPHSVKALRKLKMLLTMIRS